MSSETSNAYICEFCNKGFSTKGNLVKHNKNPCSTEPKKHICIYCDHTLISTVLSLSRLTW